LESRLSERIFMICPTTTRTLLVIKSLEATDVRTARATSLFGSTFAVLLCDGLRDAVLESVVPLYIVMD
jgi:hypothetical protein